MYIKKYIVRLYYTIYLALSNGPSSINLREGTRTSDKSVSRPKVNKNAMLIEKRECVLERSWCALISGNRVEINKLTKRCRSRLRCKWLPPTPPRRYIFVRMCLIIAAPNAITSVFRLGAKNHGTFKRALGSPMLAEQSPVCECQNRKAEDAISAPIVAQLPRSINIHSVYLHSPPDKILFGAPVCNGAPFKNTVFFSIKSPLINFIGNKMYKWILSTAPNKKNGFILRFWMQIELENFLELN